MTDRLALLAEKDFRDSFRERQIYFVGVLFLLLGLLIAYLIGSNDGTGDDLLTILYTLLFFLAPAVALAVSHDAVAGKWSEGELTVLLGLPFSRSDVVYGSVIGRTAVVATVSVVTILVATLVGAVFGAVPDLGLLVVGTLAVVVAVLVFVSLAVAFSSLSSSTQISAGGAFGVFALFLFQFWGTLPALANFALDRLGLDTIPGDAVSAWNNLTPLAALRNVAVEIVSDVQGPLSAYTPGLASGSTPVYQHPLVAGLVLVFWITVPLTLAYWRFASADV